MRKLEIDLRAAGAIDARAEQLLGGVVARPQERGQPEWVPDLAVKATLDETDIIGEVDSGSQH